MVLKMISGAAIVAVMTASVAAQSNQKAKSEQKTITGCVYQEKDVPGRAPNPAERVGIMEDYILAEISPAEAAKPVGTSGSANTPPTTYTMYKLEKAPDSQLKTMIGKRVEVTGQIDTESRDTTGQPPAGAQTDKADRIVGHDRIHLPEFEVASIRAVAGSCPAKPSTER